MQQRRWLAVQLPTLDLTRFRKLLSRHSADSCVERQGITTERSERSCSTKTGVRKLRSFYRPRSDALGTANVVTMFVTGFQPANLGLK